MIVYRNTTDGPVALSWCTSTDHHDSGEHPDPDEDVVEVVVAVGAELVYDPALANGPAITAAIDAVTPTP